MTTERVLVERDGPVAVLTLHHAARANALDAATLAELTRIEAALSSDDEIRAVVLTGSGRHFCAGVDLVEALVESPWKPGVRLGLDRLPQPVIAAVNGAARGGGFELALSCDLRVAGESATFGLPEITFGELPLAGGMVRTTRLAGAAVAKRLVLLGETLDATQAHRYGLVDHVVPDDEVLATARNLAHRLASFAGYATRTAKFVIDRVGDMDEATALDLERRLVTTMADEDQRRSAREQAADRDERYRRLLGGDAG